MLRRVRGLAVALTAVLGLALAAHKLQIYRTHLDIVRGARDFVSAIQAHVPPDGRIYQIDGSGFTGFFSEALRSRWRRARQLVRVRASDARGRLGGFLDEAQVCYVILNRRPDTDTLVDFSGLRVVSADLEPLLRSATYGRFTTTDFALYRRRTSTCTLEPGGPTLSA